MTKKMNRLEFLLEEISMEAFLKNFLPKILPESYKYNENYFLHPHSGKSDLVKSIPKKLKIDYGVPTTFVILHDQDSNDCKILKSKILKICQETCRPNNRFLVRIVCRELESWYLGDMQAIGKAFPTFNAIKYQNQAKFRNPDSLNASEEIVKLVPKFQKTSGAKLISKYIDIENNKSESFKQFRTGITQIL
ncbi:hypothetical protein FACS1894180_0180 [Bacteroidia bacterium]|nr:hypothetical protein FACS1894180_0180 [Bacteroidia bacterium]